MEILLAGDKYVDVHSFDVYTPLLDPAVWSPEGLFTKSLTKPFIIAEFDSSAIDRGSFASNPNFFKNSPF